MTPKKVSFNIYILVRVRWWGEGRGQRERGRGIATFVSEGRIHKYFLRLKKDKNVLKNDHKVIEVYLYAHYKVIEYVHIVTSW